MYTKFKERWIAEQEPDNSDDEEDQTENLGRKRKVEQSVDRSVADGELGHVDGHVVHRVSKFLDDPRRWQSNSKDPQTTNQDKFWKIKWNESTRILNDRTIGSFFSWSTSYLTNSMINTEPKEQKNAEKRRLENSVQ